MIGYTTGSAVTEVTNVIPVSADPQATEVETGGVDGDGNPITETVAAQTWTALGWSLTAPN
jgi:hypothetical protein